MERTRRIVRSRTEGKYYTFSFDEIAGALGKEKGERFADAFDITAEGNFDGVNIPNLLKSGDLNSDFSDEIQILYDYRKNRTSLHIDDKILLSWNSMMIAALSMLYRVSGNGRYLNAALKAQEFIEENMHKGVELYASWRSGVHSDESFLDDYAYYAAALIELYNSTLEKKYLNEAERFCGEAAKMFGDNVNGGYYLSKSDNTELFMNPKEIYDGAVPSGNSVMAYVLVRLYQLTENVKYGELAEKQISFMSARAGNYPSCMFLIAKMIFDNPPEHITVVLKNGDTLDNFVKPLLANVRIVSESLESPPAERENDVLCLQG